MEPPSPPTEPERLAALQAYEVMDSDPEEAFDDLVKIASDVCDAPIALITLLDDQRQWFKARIGMERTETPREHAFCAHAIVGEGPLIVPDAKLDARFRDNPLVTGDPRIRFYAGAPLRTPDGHGLGTLCVIDTSPRIDDAALSPRQLRVLEGLSRQAVRLLEHRKVSGLLARSLERVRLLAPLVPICAWCKKVRDDDTFWTSIGAYLEKHAGVQATHGICPDCVGDLERGRAPA